MLSGTNNLKFYLNREGQKHSGGQLLAGTYFLLVCIADPCELLTRWPYPRRCGSIFLKSIDSSFTDRCRNYKWSVLLILAKHFEIIII